MRIAAVSLHAVGFFLVSAFSDLCALKLRSHSWSSGGESLAQQSFKDFSALLVGPNLEYTTSVVK